MKSVTFCKYLTISVILVAGGIGCKGKRPFAPTPIGNPVRPVPGDAGQPKPPIDPNPGNTIPGDTNPRRLEGNETGIELPGREEEGKYILDRERLKQQTVYFDFDSSTVKSSEKSKADAVAAYLKSAPTHNVRVEGHCDERGTPGYNTALGERRALSVREYLIAAGIDPGRVSTTSWGEDKPAVLGFDEAAYAKNRRGEFVVLIPKTP